jgi:leucyl/phenylalanyl-tRNA--protein transferase
MRFPPKTDFPFLDEHAEFTFPSPTDEEGVVGLGGNLSPGMLLSAYRQGVFPWFQSGPPVWWNPDPRFVIFPDELPVSASMRKVIRRGSFRLSLDRGFREVMLGCAASRGKGRRGTWINRAMIEGYVRLHELGLAHSVEVWQDGELCGGLYGVSLGALFFGESMFARASNASKTAFIALGLLLASNDFQLIDSQVYNQHMASLGGRDIPRLDYLERLARGLRAPTRRGGWHELFPGFPASARAADQCLFNT